MSSDTRSEDASQMERMSGLDAGFYYFDSPGMHLHIGAILIFAKSGLAGRDPLEATRERIEARIGTEMVAPAISTSSLTDTGCSDP